MNLSKSDKYHLQSAEGWLDLDEPVEADKELEQIAPENRGHPVVQFLRCRIYLATHRVEYTQTIATSLTEKLPERPEGWFYLACASSRLGDQGTARKALDRCFKEAKKNRTQEEWKSRASDCRDLDGMWADEQLGGKSPSDA